CPRRPPPPTLFPYTTLFRSRIGKRSGEVLLILLFMLETGVVTGATYAHRDQPGYFLKRMRENADIASFLGRQPFPVRAEIDQSRSEEHTSELQSRFDLVCRL